jgi:hypothetical protein
MALRARWTCLWSLHRYAQEAVLSVRRDHEAQAPDPLDNRKSEAQSWSQISRDENPLSSASQEDDAMRVPGRGKFGCCVEWCDRAVRVCGWITEDRARSADVDTLVAATSVMSMVAPALQARERGKLCKNRPMLMRCAGS